MVNKKYTGMILKGQKLHLYESAEDMCRDMMDWKGTYDNPGFSQSAWINGVEFHVAKKEDEKSCGSESV